MQRVEYVVLDVCGENVYITADGLAYVKDSLAAKEQDYLIEKLGGLSGILAQPDIVIWDPVEVPNDTLIYYKWLYIAILRQRKLVAVIVKARQDIKFFYNLHLQESGKIKGLPIVPPSEISVWYIASKIKRGQFGL